MHHIRCKGRPFFCIKIYYRLGVSNKHLYLRPSQLSYGTWRPSSNCKDADTSPVTAANESVCASEPGQWDCKLWLSSAECGLGFGLNPHTRTLKQRLKQKQVNLVRRAIYSHGPVPHIDFLKFVCKPFPPTLRIRPVSRPLIVFACVSSVRHFGQLYLLVEVSTSKHFNCENWLMDL